jgi:hypothetical protein
MYRGLSNISPGFCPYPGLLHLNVVPLFELFPYDYLAEGTLSASGIRGVIEKVTKSFGGLSFVLF